MKILKIITKALFGLHLWLPIAYSLVFLAVAAMSEMLVGSWPYYFIGLSLSFAGALGLVYYMSVRRAAHGDKPPAPPKEKKEPRRIVPAAPVNDYESAEDAAARIRDEQMKYAQAMKATPSGISGAKYADVPPAEPVAPKAEAFMRPETMQQYYGDAVRPETTAQSAHDALYPSFSSNPAGGTESPSNSNFSPYVQPPNVASAQSASLNDFEAKSEHREKPQIYRTRKEPNVLIYEYTDSIEKFYLNPDGSLTYLCTETKR